MNKKNIPRNSPCFCGSGKKYKKCHGGPQNTQETSQAKNKTISFDDLPSDMQRRIMDKQSQGHVKSTISTKFKGHRVVGIGNAVHLSKKWKTFHDFLFDGVVKSPIYCVVAHFCSLGIPYVLPRSQKYTTPCISNFLLSHPLTFYEFILFYYIKKCLGEELYNSEIKKPLKERHPVLQWYHSLCTFQRENIKQEGLIYSADCTGQVGAYLSLAYDLYILKHHMLLQERLTERLKHIDQFQGARYEIYVTASFIKAGFDIDFEDETDKTKDHCEFTATHRSTGNKYSLEAKSRHRPGFLGQKGKPPSSDEINPKVGRLLNKALKKEALHDRIIFVDINMPPEKGIPFQKHWFEEISTTLPEIEEVQLNGKPTPQAFLFFTNHPYHYAGEKDPEPQKDFLFTAINIPEFRVNNIADVEKKYPAIIKLWESINTHNKVPSTF